MINEKKVHFSAFFCLQTILDSVVYTYQMNGECYERVQLDIMKDLNKQTIKEITQYLKYIEIQQKQLDTDENIKKTYANNFFNDNKEKGL